MADVFDMIIAGDIPAYKVYEDDDVIAVNDLLTLIDARNATGTSFLLTTHVLTTIENHADQFIYLRDGQVAAQGAAQDFATLVPDMHPNEVN